MPWFSVSALIATKIRGEEIATFVEESVYLACAASAEAAREKATDWAKRAATGSGDFTLDGKPAVHEFIGIRKVVTVSNAWPLDQDGDQPADGTELTYSVFELEGESAIEDLVAGKDVQVRYIE